MVGYAGGRPLPAGCRPVPDAFPAGGSLGGVYSALAGARAEHVLVVATDMPFLSQPLLRWMLAQARDYDVLLPLGDRPQPLHAVWSRCCLDPLRRRLESGRLRLTDVLADLRVREVPAAVLAREDPRGAPSSTSTPRRTCGGRGRSGLRRRPRVPAGEAFAGPYTHGTVMAGLIFVFGLVAVVLLVSALASPLVERAPLSFPMIFLGLGVLLGPLGMGVLDLDAHDPMLEAVAVFNLALVLFLDAARLRLDQGRKALLVLFLVLGPGTVLTVAFVAGGGTCCSAPGWWPLCCSAPSCPRRIRWCCGTWCATGASPSPSGTPSRSRRGRTTSSCCPSCSS